MQAPALRERHPQFVIYQSSFWGSNFWHQGPYDKPWRRIRILIETENAAILKLKNKQFWGAGDKVCSQTFHKRQMTHHHQIIFCV